MESLNAATAAHDVNSALELLSTLVPEWRREARSDYFGDYFIGNSSCLFLNCGYTNYTIYNMVTVQGF